MVNNLYKNSLVVSYIKELLHDFNLPMIPVWTEELDKDSVFNEYTGTYMGGPIGPHSTVVIDKKTGDNKTINFPGRTYIKGSSIVRYNGKSYDKIGPYYYNEKTPNITKNFIINSSGYDQYTHRYLGDYLRFIRDYRGVNLMNLYNCFFNFNSKKIIKNFSWSKSNYKTNKIYYQYFKIDTDDENYNYYLVPVKFNNYYTIGISSGVSYEMSCILYNDKVIDKTPLGLIRDTYVKVSGSHVNKPFIFSTYSEESKKIWCFEEDLHIIIKIPKSVKTSIVVLEGNWVDCCNSVDGKMLGEYRYSIFDGEVGDKMDQYTKLRFPKNYFSRNSLLSYNNEKSYPFSDSLVEYLMNNVISPLDKISTNIERIQDLLYPNGLEENIYGVWSDNLRNKIFYTSDENDYVNKGEKFNTITSGNISPGVIPVIEWDSEGITGYKSFKDIHPDINYYVDSDTESFIESRYNNRGKENG